MSTLSSGRLLTAEEFAALPSPPDGSQQELVKGVILTVPPPSFYHGICCILIGRLLGNFAADRGLGYVTNNDSGVIIERDPDTVRGPDVAYWSKERLPEVPRKGYPAVVPDLAVEVMSPSDVFFHLLRKAEEYTKAGVRLVWIVVPEDGGVAVYRPGGQIQLLTSKDTVTGEDVLPGFSCPVAQFFP